MMEFVKEVLTKRNSTMPSAVNDDGIRNEPLSTRIHLERGAKWTLEEVVRNVFDGLRTGG